jgi:hypothetical protein
MDLAFGLSIRCQKSCLTQLVHSQTHMHANKSWCVHAGMIITQSFMHLVAPFYRYIYTLFISKYLSPLIVKSTFIIHLIFKN